MPRKTRLHYTDEMKTYIWERYNSGDSVRSIAWSFDRSSSSIHGYLSGTRPPERRREPPIRPVFSPANASDSLRSRVYLR